MILSANKMKHVASNLGLRTTGPGSDIHIKYRGIEIATFEEDDGAEPTFKWITTLALNKHLDAPFIETKGITKERAMEMLIEAYVKPVYKKFKKARRNHAPTLPSGKRGILSDEQFTKDLAEMKAYVDRMLALPKHGGTTFASRLIMWHHHARSLLPCVECIKRIDFIKLEESINGSESNIVEHTLFNGVKVTATMVRKCGRILFSHERLFIFQDGWRIVIVKCSRASAADKSDNEMYYKVKETTVLEGEITKAIMRLTNESEKENEHAKA